MRPKKDTDLGFKMLVVSFLGQAVIDYGLIQKPSGTGGSSSATMRQIKVNGGKESIMDVLKNSGRLLAMIGLNYSSDYLMRKINTNKRISRGTIPSGFKHGGVNAG